jgi:hypothetical protein
MIKDCLGDADQSVSDGSRHADRPHRQSCHRSAVRPAFPVGREGLGRAGSAAPLPTAMSPEWRNMMCHPYG